MSFIKELQEEAKINFRKMWGNINKDTQHFTTEKIEDMNNTLITHTALRTIQKVKNLVSTHTEHNGDYCDTGGDMEWQCRSECVEMALNRLSQLQDEIKKNV